MPAGLASLKPVTKVMYTGKRGRPKKVKPGMHDPHQAERREIEERLMRDYPALASQINKEEEEEEEEEEGEEEEVGEDEYDEEYKYSDMAQEQGSVPATSESQSMDPSSEAEALSNVASGIAASLMKSNAVQVRGIPRDTWNMFLNFTSAVGSDLSTYDDTEAWPRCVLVYPLTCCCC